MLPNILSQFTGKSMIWCKKKKKHKNNHGTLAFSANCILILYINKLYGNVKHNNLSEPKRIYSYIMRHACKFINTELRVVQKKKTLFERRVNHTRIICVH